jgi:Acyclic terpene utilisation family protein AtuA
VTKLDGTGGCVTAATVKEQLLYEVHDPACYVTPDVTADFSKVAIDAIGHDCVAVSNAGGGERPRQLKVTVGFDGGFIAEGGISYAGPGATGDSQHPSLGLGLTRSGSSRRAAST